MIFLFAARERFCSDYPASDSGPAAAMSFCCYALFLTSALLCFAHLPFDSSQSNLAVSGGDSSCPSEFTYCNGVSSSRDDLQVALNTPFCDRDADCKGDGSCKNNGIEGRNDCVRTIFDSSSGSSSLGDNGNSNGGSGSDVAEEQVDDGLDPNQHYPSKYATFDQKIFDFPKYSHGSNALFAFFILFLLPAVFFCCLTGLAISEGANSEERNSIFCMFLVCFTGSLLCLAYLPTEIDWDFKDPSVLYPLETGKLDTKSYEFEKYSSGSNALFAFYIIFAIMSVPFCCVIPFACRAAMKGEGGSPGVALVASCCCCLLWQTFSLLCFAGLPSLHGGSGEECALDKQCGNIAELLECMPKCYCDSTDVFEQTILSVCGETMAEGYTCGSATSTAPSLALFVGSVAAAVVFQQ
jgi:hypothetical protein